MSDTSREQRPANFGDFVGQANICDSLQISIAAAQRRDHPLDHVLFSGPGGLGKTTLCNIIVDSMGGRLYQTNGGVIKGPQDLIGTLVRLQKGDILFIDEIHRIPMTAEEYLYTAMEDFAIDSIAANGAAVRLNLNPFTILGATTREGQLSEPLLTRFGIIARLLPYSPQDLVMIIMRTCLKWEQRITQCAALHIAHRSRGTPRIALRTLRRVRDYADDEIDLDVARNALNRLGIYELGLTGKDISVLSALARSESPMGLTTLALMAHDEQATIESVLEPHLLREGLIDRTSRGRMLTKLGREYLEQNT